jgi:hypothetical protein
MAKIQAGILSAPVGKIAGVVGFKWKSKSCIRQYVIPKYSNTDLQVGQRNLFKLAAKFASGFLGQVIQPYMDKYIRDMSGYNDCIQYNIASLADPVDPYGATKITRGNLFPPQSVEMELDLGRTEITWTWTDELGSNGKLTDKMIGAAYDTTTGLCYFSVELATRTTKTLVLAVPSPTPATEWVTYLFCAQYAALILDKISDSVVTQEA